MSKKNVLCGVAVAVFGFFALSAPRLVAAPQSSGSSGGWDYLEVDPATHRLFISRGTHVIVVDREQRHTECCS